MGFVGCRRTSMSSGAFLATATLAVAFGVLAPGFAPSARAVTTYSVAATIPVAVESSGGSIAVAPSIHRAYVTSYASDSLAVIDTATNSVVQGVAIGHRPIGVVVDTIPREVVKAAATGDAVSQSAIVSPIQQTPPTVFVANYGGSSISVIDSSTNAITATIPLGGNVPQGLAVDPSTHTLYAAGGGSSAGESFASVIDGSRLTVTETVTTTGFFTAAAVDSGLHKAFFSGCCLAKMWELDGPTDTQISSLTVPGTAGVAVNSTTHRAYVTNGNTDSGAVSVVDTSTGLIVTTVAVGSSPAGVAVDANTNVVYVSNARDNTVSVIDGATNQVVSTVPVGTAPGMIAVDATTHTAYVINQGGNTVSVITRTVTGPVTRLAGTDRFGTAVAISKAEFPSGGANAVVLARSDDYPDALVGAPLAVAKNAPLLLTTGTSLPSATKAEIQRVLAAGKTVYVLGGTLAVPASIETELTGMGYLVTRYSGADRFATAVKVADALGDPPTVLLATGTNFPDALSAGVAAVKTGGVVLLTNGSTTPPETSAYLSAHPGTVYAVGGPAATADPSATAIVGTDRYATAVDVATTFFSAPTTIGFATGLSFPDALSGGALLGRAPGPLLLVSTSSVPTSVTSYLGGVKASITKAYLFGGTSTVTADVEDGLNTALGG